VAASRAASSSTLAGELQQRTSTIQAKLIAFRVRTVHFISKMA
jgi:hypothetical protein